MRTKNSTPVSYTHLDVYKRQVVNIVLSAMALGRYSDRYAGKPAENSVESFLDSYYPDERMERVYPNAIIKE